MKTLHLWMKPAPMGPAWLSTPDAGNHEFGRVFFHEGSFTLGPDRPNRLGPEAIESADYVPEVGVTIRTTHYHVFVPASTVQSAVWSR